MIGEKLEALEVKVKAAVALITQLRGEKALLQATVEEREHELHAKEEHLKRLEADRNQALEKLKGLQEEREEVRSKVEALLEEIAQIEASREGQE